MNAYTILNNQFTVFTDPASGKKFAKCSYCESLLKYHHSTSSLTYHLRSKHSVGLFPNAATSADVKPVVSTQSTSGFPVQQQQKGRCAVNNYEIALHLTKWIAADARPLNILEDEGLKHLLQAATGSSSFVMPTKQSVTTNIENLYEKQKCVVRDLLAQAEYIALTTDSWTSCEDSFSSIRCHYISADWNRRSMLLGVEHNLDKFMNVDIDEHLSSLMMSYRSEIDGKLFHLVINSLTPANDSELVKMEHTPCFAHLLLLSINNAMVACSLDDKIANEILAYYNSYVEEHPTDLQAKLLLENLPMGQDVATSWRRMYLMIDCLLKNRGNIQKQPTVDEWLEFASLHKLLEPFQKAIAILGGNSYATASSILPLIAYLRQQMTVNSEQTSYVQEFKQVFLNQLNSYVGNTLHCEHLQLATAFDIRYKRLLSLPKEKRKGVWETISSITRTMVETKPAVADQPSTKKPRSSMLSLASGDGSMTDVATEPYLSEFEMYKHLPQINDDDLCPLQWWKENSSTYPTLCKVAKKYLAIPSTSVPCEQLFSNAREMLNRKRSAIFPDDVHNLLCLSDWLSPSL